MTAELPARPEWDRLRRIALLAGAVGLGLCVLGAVAGALVGGREHSPHEEVTFANSLTLIDPAQFFRSYLLAYVIWLGVGLGSMALLMVHHLTGGFWGWAIRGAIEAATRTVPFLALLFLPLLLGLDKLYPWATWSAEEIAGSATLVQKSRYLNVPRFVVFAAIFLAAWSVLSWLLTRGAEGGPRAPAEPEPRRLRMLSAGGLVVYGLTMTFAAIDWIMSLEPMWYSTIFGPMIVTGQVLAGLAFAIAATVCLAPPAELSAALTKKQLRDLGSLLVAFVLLWAYMSFSQYLLIWSANLKEEVPWYLKRTTGGWEVVAVLLILLGFVTPFLLLLSRDVKQNPRALAAVAVLILLVHVLDRIWLLVPAYVSWQRVRIYHWMDTAAFVGVGGLWVALFLTFLRRRPLLPAPPGGEAHHHG